MNAKLFSFELEKIKSGDFASREIVYEIAQISVVAENEDQAQEKVEFFLAHEPHVRIRLLK